MKTTVKYNSNISKILRGQTKGYHDWYIKEIMQNSDNYIIEEKYKIGQKLNYNGVTWKITDVQPGFLRIESITKSVQGQKTIYKIN
tara:strand:+ start:333 stop:590 length:258 start_codon:yes stop_codon:yes gene_type:complete